MYLFTQQLYIINKTDKTLITCLLIFLFSIIVILMIFVILLIEYILLVLHGFYQYFIYL
jgi:hypothetical protein